MLKFELVRCPKCGKIFKKTTGGFIKGINEDSNICFTCKSKSLKNIFNW